MAVPGLRRPAASTLANPPRIAARSNLGMVSNENGRELMRLSQQRFVKKDMIDDFCQTVADEIHPSRSDFTRDRVPGEEFGNHLYTSMPAQNLRDLAYALGSLTRPKNQQWFAFKAREEWRNTPRAKVWFTHAKDKQRTLLYTQRANFIPTMELSDKDVLAFGNSVVGHVEDARRSGLLVFQTFHFRDCAFAEDDTRHIIEIHRKFKIALANWEMRFPGVAFPTMYDEIRKRDPWHEIEMRHIVMPLDLYECYRPIPPAIANMKRKPKFASVYLDVTRQCVVKEGTYFEFPYTVRRWQLMDNTPYARSPAADLGLIEARLLQNQERVLMDAGELAVDPPTVATRDAVLGDINNFPGGTTWVDYDYDERNGPSLKVVEHKSNLPIGLEMKTDTRQVLAAAMFINKLTLPMGTNDMTVPEINERISEYIRSIGPAVEPFEVHNAMMLDSSFLFNLRVGNFGPLQAVPPELRGADVEFEMDGPIQVAQKRQKLMKAKETVQTVGEITTAVAQLDPQKAHDILDHFDLEQIATDAADYIGGEPEWQIPPEVVAMKQAQRQAEIDQAKQLAKMQQVGQMAQGAIGTVPHAVQAEQMLRAHQQQTGAAQDTGNVSDDTEPAGWQSPEAGPSEAEVMGAPPNGTGLEGAPQPSGYGAQSGQPEMPEAAPGPTVGQVAPSAPIVSGEAPAPKAGSSKDKEQDKKIAELENALHDLVRVLGQPVNIHRDQHGRAVGWHRGDKQAEEKK